MKTSIAAYGLFVAIFGFNFSANFEDNVGGWLAVLALFCFLVGFLGCVMRPDREPSRASGSIKIGGHWVTGTTRPPGRFDLRRWVDVTVVAGCVCGFILGAVLAHVPLAVAYAGWLVVFGLFALCAWFVVDMSLEKSNWI